MVAFTKMWNDVFKLINENEDEDLKIVEKFKSGFIVLNEEDREFITKEDFVDFWCKLLYYNEIPTEKLIGKNFKSEYVYSLVSRLPYVSENEGILRLVEE